MCKHLKVSAIIYISKLMNGLLSIDLNQLKYISFKEDIIFRQTQHSRSGFSLPWTFLIKDVIVIKCSDVIFSCLYVNKIFTPLCSQQYFSSSKTLQTIFLVFQTL